jgi:23S rRNA pseudouridine1911/1915/1917 synthase
MTAFHITSAESGRTVLEVLQARLRISKQRILNLVQERRARVAGSICTSPGWLVKRGQKIEVLPGGKAVGPQVSKLVPIIRHVDSHVVVVEKPAGLTTMRHADEAAEFGKRGKRFLPATLADMLPGLLAQKLKCKPVKVYAVHRLDRDTSGLVVFARTKDAERHLGIQFRAKSTERHYLAIVRGRAKNGQIASFLVDDRGDARRGSTKLAGQGKRAVTQVKVLEDLGEFSLVECLLDTGRTHQVRIHLGESGTPICGERIYDRPVHGKPLPDKSGSMRLALHAASLGFEHPATGKMMRWESPLPADLADLLRRLRKLPKPV